MLRFLIVLLVLIGGSFGTGVSGNVNGSIPEGDRCAIVTLVYQSHAKDDGFVLGAQNLGYSLLLSNTKHDMIALVTDQVSDSQLSHLSKAGWINRQVKAIRNHNTEHASRLDYIFSKLQIFSLVEYKRVIYLDADTLVTENIDNLCSCKGLYCAVVRNTFFNAGVMVVQPNETIFREMLKASTEVHSYTGGDQGFLNNFFWNPERCPFFDPRMDTPSSVNCHRIPGFYNGDVGMYIARGDKWQFDPNEEMKEPFIIHYTLSIFKPWHWWSYPVVSESWRWWNVLSESEPRLSQLGILSSVVAIAPMLIFWALLINHNMQVKWLFPTQSKRRIPSCYHYSSMVKVLIAHSFNVDCFAIAYWYSDFPILHPIANAIVFYVTYCTLFELFCIQLFNFLFREPVPEVTIQSLAGMGYGKSAYPKTLMIHRLYTYISLACILLFVMMNASTVFVRGIIFGVWLFITCGIELTFFIIKNYPTKTPIIE
jgi:lipopolysaccharide biosynthesis glycosyltransferase